MKIVEVTLENTDYNIKNLKVTLENDNFTTTTLIMLNELLLFLLASSVLYSC